MDCSFITRRVATGAAISVPADVDWLVAQGVTHVVDCRSDFDDTPLLAGHPLLAYLWNGTEDDGAVKTPDWFAKTLSFALTALSTPRHRIYLHCAAGVNRGPSSAYAVIRSVLGLPGAVVLDMIHVARPATLSGIHYAVDADAALIALGYLGVGE